MSERPRTTVSVGACTASRSPVLTRGGICVPPTVTYLPYRVSGSTLTAVRRSQLLARWPGTHSQNFIQDPTSSTDCLGVYLKRTCSCVTSACSANEQTDTNDCQLMHFVRLCAIQIHGYTNPCNHSLKSKIHRTHRRHIFLRNALAGNQSCLFVHLCATKIPVNQAVTLPHEASDTSLAPNHV